MQGSPQYLHRYGWQKKGCARRHHENQICSRLETGGEELVAELGAHEPQDSRHTGSSAGDALRNPSLSHPVWSAHLCHFLTRRSAQHAHGASVSYS